jgi:hypothetical protein
MLFHDLNLAKAIQEQRLQSLPENPGDGPSFDGELTVRERLLLRVSDLLINTGKSLRKSVQPQTCVSVQLSYGKR